MINKPKFKIDRLLLLLAFMRFIVDSSYSVMAPFLPQILAEKGVDPSLNGYIFSTFSIALIFAAPMVGYYLARYERMIFLRCGLFILGLSMLGFGLSVLIEGHKTTFLVVVFICRALQGAASSVNDTTILSITGLMYKDHQDVAIAIILMFSGIGYSLAPFFGSLLYDYVGQMSPFIVFSAIQITFSMTLGCLLTSDVNNRLIDSVYSMVQSMVLQNHNDTN